MSAQSDVSSDLRAQRRWLIGLSITVGFGIFGAVMAVLAYTNRVTVPGPRGPAGRSAPAPREPAGTTAPAPPAGTTAPAEPATPAAPAPDKPGNDKDHGHK